MPEDLPAMPMEDLILELERLRVENARLREEVKAYSRGGGSPCAADVSEEGGDGGCAAPAWAAGAGHGLTGAQIHRYSRQLLLPAFRVGAQERLCKGAVLVVEAGGLGFLVALYDVVVDASDNVTTRYLVSDACVVANRPVVSGEALGMERQLTVYNYSKGGVVARAPPRKWSEQDDYEQPRALWQKMSKEDQEQTAKNIAGHIQGANDTIIQRQLGVFKRCDLSLAQKVEEMLGMKQKSEDPYTMVA